MILENLFAILRDIGPALGNHIWQSSVFAVVAGILTLFLRRNQARVRYAVWLTASAKFLIPFALLVGLGSHLGWMRGAAQPRTAISAVMEQMSDPFAASVRVVPQAAPVASSLSLANLLPVILLGIWLGGFVAIVILWLARWWRISAGLHAAGPICIGREVETLRRLERAGSLPKKVEMRLSKASLEPGIFGLANPVLVWPEGISARLSDAHLEVILAHELWHVRRRDNLAAVLHMIVEVLFWFHPFVWWMGTKLVEERERACDEAVLESGSDRHVYAESILRICEFCVGSPLSCVSGVTGADLKKRIGRIASGAAAKKLDFGKKLLLGVTGLAAVATPLAFGMVHMTSSRSELLRNASALVPEYNSGSMKANAAGAGAALKAHQSISNNADLRYQTVSIERSKPEETMMRFQNSADRFTAINMTVQKLVGGAYGLEPMQVIGGPDWVGTNRYDIQAKMDEPTLNKLQSLTQEQRILERKRMLQAFLASRFQMALHQETKDLPVYTLVVSKSGSKLKTANPDETYSDGIKGFDGKPTGPHTMRVAIGEFTAQGLPMTEIVSLLTNQVDRIVVDKTGLTGQYDFTLKWTLDATQPPALRGEDAQRSGPSRGPSIFAAIQDQLGLELRPQTAPMEVVVVDRVARPAGN